MLLKKKLALKIGCGELQTLISQPSTFRYHSNQFSQMVFSATPHPHEVIFHGKLFQTPSQMLDQ